MSFIYLSNKNVCLGLSLLCLFYVLCCKEILSVSFFVVQGELMGQYFQWDRQTPGPVSSEVRHDKDPSLLKVHNFQFLPAIAIKQFREGRLTRRNRSIIQSGYPFFTPCDPCVWSLPCTMWILVYICSLFSPIKHSHL